MENIRFFKRKSFYFILFFTRLSFFEFTHFFSWEEETRRINARSFSSCVRLDDITRERSSLARTCPMRISTLKILRFSIRTRGIEISVYYYFLASRTNAQCDAAVGLKSIIKKSWRITIFVYLYRLYL